MNKLTPLLIIRYLLGSTYERSISIVTVICFISITIAASSLTLVNAVMRGFQIAVHEKLQGIHADAQIQSYGQPLHTVAIDSVIQKEFPEVVATSPVHIGHALIQPDKDDPPAVIMIQAIDPEKEQYTSTIGKKICTPHTLISALQKNQIIIGKSLAENNGLAVGAPITLYYLDELKSSSRASIQSAQAIVGGILQTGIDEYDAHLILSSESFFQKLFAHDGASILKIAFAPETNHQAVIARLHQRLMLDVYSWKQLYPSLVSALELERYAMFFILLLITIVASMNIIALLFMLIQAKRSDIAILHSMGAPIGMIKSIFIGVALTITTAATLLGLSIAALICWILNTYPFLKLPDAYYVSHLPAHLEWSMALGVFATITIIAILATLLPLGKIGSMATAQVLRYEG